MKPVVSYLARRELPGVSVLLGLALLIFFAPTIFTGGYFAPGDIIRIFAPFANGFHAHNSLLSDPLVQFIPWFKLNRELIRSGHLPLWNIYSGGGLPLLANMQSQVLWPLSIFIYLFNFKIGLLLYAAGKLFLIGLFTYLYLREIKLTKTVALIGAIGFMLAGFNVVWLMWPHTNEIFLLPLGFYLVERYFRTDEPKLLLWFSLALAIGLFGGHPETFFHVVFAVSVYIAYSLFVHRRSWPDFAGQTARWLGTGLLGLGLSALLLLPFIEYLRLSQAAADRGLQLNPYFLPKVAAVVNFIPDFFGNPSLGDHYYLSAANFNYNETTMGYVGITLGLLAILVVIWQWRNRLVSFFALLGAFCLAVTYHFPIVFDLVTRLPVFHSAANHRLMVVFAWAVVVLACLGLQRLTEANFNRRQIGWAGLTLLALAALAAGYAHLRAPGFIQGGKSVLRMNEWQLIFTSLFVVNLVALIAILLWAPTKQRLLLIGCLVFIETGLHGAVYNTTSSNANFYPDSPAVAYLAQHFPDGYDKTFTANGILLPPNLGAWYGFDHVNDNDAVGLTSYTDLKRGIGTLVPGWETYAAPLDLDRLAFLGAKYLVFPPDIGRQMLAAHPGRLQIGYQDDSTVILTQPVLPRAYLVSTKDVVTNLLAQPDPTAVNPVQSYRLDRTGQEEIKLTTKEDAYLILTENYYPGWQATINGRTTPIESVHGLRAIAVPAGTDTVETSYRPNSLRFGLIVSLVSLFIWLGLLRVTDRKIKISRATHGSG